MDLPWKLYKNITSTLPDLLRNPVLISDKSVKSVLEILNNFMHRNFI